MRDVSSLIRLMVVSSACILSVNDIERSRAEEKDRDFFKPGTVWKGHCDSEKPYFPDDEPEVMVLYVKQRKGRTVEVLAWYPAMKNRLVLLKGRVEETGKVTLKEEKLIFKNDTVAPAFEYAGQLKGHCLKGSWEWKGPTFGPPIKGTFLLKLAD